MPPANSWETDAMLTGMMMNRPLLISGLIDFAGEVYGTIPMVSQTVEGGIHRYTYADSRKRIAKLANALVAMGVKPGDRVATLAWNGYRHFELYFAISGIGAVCHTINPRLSVEQFIYIVNHAEDTALFFDITFAPIVAKLKEHWKPVKSYVAMTDAEHMPDLPGALCYETLIAPASDQIVWPEFPENTAAALCYTSGTTGDPKGALYSHRSTVLHSLYSVATINMAFGSDRSILPVVPLFHVNAWGLPYSCSITGTTLIFPGAKLDGASLFELMESEHAAGSWGVPTVWLGLLAEMKKRGRKPVGLKHVLIGGSAAPKPMIETFEKDYGVTVIQGWGMTEMSPLGTVGHLLPNEQDLEFKERVELKAKQGRRVYGVDLKIVDEAGTRLPHDDVAAGELFVRGNAIVSGYYKNEAASARALDSEGWFATGDVARISPGGMLTIVDRTKDLVKSGGEWISSIDVENAAMAHPGLANCAVIGIPHPKWTERPVLIAVKAPGAEPTKEEILALLDTKLAKWQLPDDVIFVDSLPIGATGKVSKRDLRTKFADHKLPDMA
jgi:3-(methylthio)propionyl---CoA ligase